MFFFNCALTKKREIPGIARVVSSCARLRFGGFERKRKREAFVRPFFFSFVALLGRPFSIASGAERARVEREKEKEIRATFQP